MTRDDCLAQTGEYQGNGTDCDPNPCVIYESGCLIISEVVMGVESGGCPRWIEITNTGLGDISFVEGGIIVQDDAGTDVDVDIDLSGVTIPAGLSFVISSNQLGACTAKRIVLTHFGYEMLARLDDIAWECGEDGMVIQL